MRKGDYLDAILRSNKTVFTFKDISLLWGEAGTNTSRVRINSYVRTGKLLGLRRGLYAKDKNYNHLELATKIITPAYVSCETVLAQSGLIFKNQSQIFVVAYLTRDIICDGQKYSFKKIKSPLLTNSIGVENKDGYSVATTERAFLDTLYLNKDYYCDNLQPLDWNKVFAILPLYNNKRMTNQIKKLYKQFWENNHVASLDDTECYSQSIFSANVLKKFFDQSVTLA